MDFAFSERCLEYRQTLLAFMDECIYPNEARYESEIVASGNPHHQPPVMEELKVEARRRGLWNLFQPHEGWGPGLTQPRVRAAGRGHGAQPDRVGGVQLLRA